MPIPEWASDRIAREVDAYLARGGSGYDDPSLVEAARRLRAWPVYGDLGATLLLGTDGEVYYQDHNTMEVARMPNPHWRLRAWQAAADAAPELKGFLPPRPADATDCRECGGTGRVRIGTVSNLWCGVCEGLGWVPTGGPRRWWEHQDGQPT